MSSHREAPQISKDPTADSTDLYAFVSPDAPDTVTIIANYIPLQAPDGGPSFYEFADDVRYEILIDNDGDGEPEVGFRFRFKTVNNTPTSFLYNTGPITKLTPPGTKGTTWNRQQTLHFTRVDYSKTGKERLTYLGAEILVPPCNVGERSTPNYEETFLPSSGTSAIHKFNKAGFAGKVFAGQRADAFFVDLGSIFDLGGLRPLNQAHEIKLPVMDGVNALGASNVHSLAIQVPIKDVVKRGVLPGSYTSKRAVIGVWTVASRQKMRVTAGSKTGEDTASGPWVQVSRLGNPLVNEAIIGLEDKDYWNSRVPTADGKHFFKYFANPQLARLLPDLYPGAFPNLDAYNKTHTGTTPATAARPDLIAILLSGIPKNIIPGLATNVGGTALADQLRLNVAIPPSSNPNSLGVLGGDNAGFPNGRRVTDNITTIELRALAGATLHLVDPNFTADTTVSSVSDGTTGPATLPMFPYLNTPYSGYYTPDATPDGDTGEK